VLQEQAAQVTSTEPYTLRESLDIVEIEGALGD
jgi:hypothetical protein